MPRSRPASNPLSFHRPTGQYYVTRRGKRIYLGADPDEAAKKYHRLALGGAVSGRARTVGPISAKELANRFVAAQEANWRSQQATGRGYTGWLKRFLEDHPGLLAEEFTVEAFAAWKLSLRQRGYAPESINHYLSAVRAAYRFGEDTDLIERGPRLSRVRNESCSKAGSGDKPLYSPREIRGLLTAADSKIKLMILLGLNCAFGPKDIQDLAWNDIAADRVTLPRSKTGVCQTFLLWPETKTALDNVRAERSGLLARLAKRGRLRSDGGRVFVTRYWRGWNKDAIAEQFRKLCKAVRVPCYGFYRLRHCASTAVSLVANPHVQRRFMRHSQLQQQVTYTHTPDAEVDAAISRARGKLLGEATEGLETSREPVEVA